MPSLSFSFHGATVLNRHVLVRGMLTGVFVALCITLCVVAIVTVAGLRSHRNPPLLQTSPCPAITVQPPARVNIALISDNVDDTDSVRTILYHDFEHGDWLHVLPLDSISQARVVIRVVRITDGVRVTLGDTHSHVVCALTYALGVAPTQPISHTTVVAERWMLHGVADQIVQGITGHRGIAQSRIAYIAHGEVHIVDADGANDHAVTHNGPVLSPAWRHDGRAIVYTMLNDAGTRVAQIDLASGVSTPLPLPLRGLNITPVYTPDDRWIVFAHGEAGIDLVAVRRDCMLLPRPSLYLPPCWIDIGHGFDNFAPTLNPDGTRVAFVSSRFTTPQIYSVRIDGTDERLETPITRQGRSYRASPDWSPDGRTIAFEQQDGDFQIWLVTVATHVMRRVTSIGENEDPSWAPDARHLAFTATRAGAKNIWVLDIESGRERQLTTGGDARLAAWSSRLSAVY